MKHVLLPAALLGSFLATPVDELAFAPEDGTKLTRTFVTDAVLELDEVTLELNGNEQDADAGGFTITDTERIVVTDEILSSEEGRPTKLRRTFDEVLNETVYSAEAAEEDQETEESSDLVGSTVLFVWDADAEEYEITDEAEELEEDLLAGLYEDMDLRLFLPDGEVEAEDSWSVDSDAMRDLMWPGGFMHYRAEGEEPDEDDEEVNRQIYENISGDITATYAGARDEDGTQVAVITIEAEINGTSEVEREVGDGAGTETRTIEFSRTVEGEYLWSLDGGHLHAIAFTGAESLSFITTAELEAPDGSEFSFKDERIFSGTVEYAVTVEPAE
jgi:hypothetical protein